MGIYQTHRQQQQQAAEEQQEQDPLRDDKEQVADLTTTRFRIE